MVDCIFDLWVVDAGGTIVDVILDCMLRTVLDLCFLCWTSMRRYSAVSLCFLMTICICVVCVQNDSVDKMVLVVFGCHDGSCFLNWCHVCGGTDRDSDAVRT